MLYQQVNISELCIADVTNFDLLRDGMRVSCFRYFCRLFGLLIFVLEETGLEKLAVLGLGIDFLRVLTDLAVMGIRIPVAEASDQIAFRALILREECQAR